MMNALPLSYQGPRRRGTSDTLLRLALSSPHMLCVLMSLHIVSVAPHQTKWSVHYVISGLMAPPNIGHLIPKTCYIMTIDLMDANVFYTLALNILARSYS